MDAFDNFVAEMNKQHEELEAAKRELEETKQKSLNSIAENHKILKETLENHNKVMDDFMKQSDKDMEEHRKLLDEINSALDSF